MSLKLLMASGEYLISVELGSSSEYFDIKSISLLRNGKVESTDEHTFLGKGWQQYLSSYSEGLQAW